MLLSFFANVQRPMALEQDPQALVAASVSAKPCALAPSRGLNSGSTIGEAIEGTISAGNEHRVKQYPWFDGTNNLVGAGTM